MVLVFVCIIWGGAFPAIKYLLSFLTPLQLVKVRYILATPFFLAILLTKDRKKLLEVFRRFPLILLVASFFGVIGYNLSLAIGEVRIPSGIASLIINLSPIFTMALSFVFLKERITPSTAVGMMISFLGLFLLVRLGGGSEKESSGYYLYALITILAPLSWAIYTVASKKLTDRYDTFTVTGLTIVLGTFPLFFTLCRADFQAMAAMNTKAWITLLYLSYISTSLGYTVWVLALRRLPSSKVASFVYLIPVFSVIISRIFLKEPITLFIISGATLLLSGVYIVNKSKSKKQQA